MVGGLVYYVVVVAMWRTICGLTTDIAIATSSMNERGLVGFRKGRRDCRLPNDRASERRIFNAADCK